MPDSFSTCSSVRWRLRRNSSNRLPIRGGAGRCGIFVFGATEFTCTGFAPRDVTPEATRAALEREAPGIPEALRAASLAITKHAMLSRQVAGIRKRTLIINLPGQPKSIRETLQGLPDAPGIFAAVPYCIDLIGGPYIETHEAVVKAFRPKSAQRPKSK